MPSRTSVCTLSSLLYVEQDAPEDPDIKNCQGVILKLHIDEVFTNPAAQKLCAVLDVLPVIDWKQGGRRKFAPVTTTRSRFKLLLDEKWKMLLREAANALAFRQPAAANLMAAQRRNLGPLPIVSR